jgi:Stress responsive A/B Barrel Domain.
MVKHIVFWKLKEEALGNDKAINAQMAKEKLEALNGQIKGLLKLEVGVDLSKTDMSYDLALYSEFANMEDLHFYDQHPLHVVVKGFIKEINCSRKVVDYEI